MAWVLLSASVERCFVSRMRDFLKVNLKDEKTLKIISRLDFPPMVFFSNFSLLGGFSKTLIILTKENA